MTIKRILPLLLLLFGLSLTAQDFIFRSISVDDGLVGSNVNCFWKDSRGLMWIGTNSGMTCYDGQHFRNYQSHYLKATALPDNRIESIQEDGTGLLWIRANQNYVTMDPHTRIVDRAVSQRLTMLGNSLEPDLVFVDKDGNLWVYIEGKSLFYYKINQRLIYSFDQAGDNPTLPEGRITSIADSEIGVVVAYADGTVLGINTAKQTIEWVNNVISRNKMGTDNYKVLQDTLQNIWLYGQNSTFYYDEQTSAWYRTVAEFANLYGLTWTDGNDLVRGATIDERGNVWLATERNGLICYSPKRRVARRIKHAGYEDHFALNSNYLQSVYYDGDDGLWVGTQHKGLCYGSQSMYLFRSSPVGDVNAIASANDTLLWLATNNKGLLRYNTQTHRATNIPTTNLCDNVFSCILQTKDGSVWIGSQRNGLDRIKNGDVQHFNLSNGLKSTRINALAEDIYGNVWIATKGGGLHCYSAKNGHFSYFEVVNGKLHNNNVSSLFIEGNHLVAGTDDGLVSADISRGDFTTIYGTKLTSQRLPSCVISAAAIDKTGTYWIGTSEGLNMLNLQSDELMTLTTESHGLPSNIICGVVVDKQNNIWVTTDAGICCLRPIADAQIRNKRTFAVTNYGIADGLLSTNFNRNSLCLTRTGQLYFGASGGLSYLQESAKVVSEDQYKLIFSALYLNDMLTTEINSPKILPKVLNSCSGITVPSSMNDVRIEVSLSNYASKRNRPHITYLLKGGPDNNWHPIQSDGHTVLLGKMPAGEYELHIKAADEAGRPVATERVMHIKVNAVWYKTWPFLLTAIVLFLLFVGVIMFLIPYIRNAYFVRMREIADLRLRRKQMEDKANEIRQEAILIAPQLGLLQMEVKDPSVRERLQSLQHTVRGFIDKLNELRDNHNIGGPKSMDSAIGADVLIEANEDSSTGSDDFLLIADDGVVQGNAYINSSGEIIERQQADARIVLMDSDQDMLDFMADCLKGNFDVTTFTKADEAWESIYHNPPHAIVCSTELQGSTGSEFCHRVKSERSLDNIPFIITTPKMYSLTELDDNNVTMMADDYIPQPMNLKALIVRLYRLLNKEYKQKDDLKNDETMRNADTMSMSVKLQLRKCIEDYVMQNISRKDLSIDELGRALGVSRTLLFRRIEAVTGRVPADYIRAIRLQEVAKLLSETTLSLGDIASEMGFVNAQTLSYYFKLEYGVLPTEYMDIAGSQGAGGEGNTMRQQMANITQRG